MVPSAHTDAENLNVSKDRSQAGAHIMLSEDVPVPSYNVLVLTGAQIIKFVMTSAAESELSGLYIFDKEKVPLRQALVEMCWLQPRSPIQFDDYTAVGVANETIIPHKTNSMDIKFHCLRCRYAQLVPWVTTTVTSTTTLLALVKGAMQYPCQGEQYGGSKREERRQERQQ